MTSRYLPPATAEAIADRALLVLDAIDLERDPVTRWALRSLLGVSLEVVALKRKLDWDLEDAVNSAASAAADARMTKLRDAIAELERRVEDPAGTTIVVDGDRLGSIAQVLEAMDESP